MSAELGLQIAATGGISLFCAAGTAAFMDDESPTWLALTFISRLFLFGGAAAVVGGLLMVIWS